MTNPEKPAVTGYPNSDFGTVLWSDGGYKPGRFVATGFGSMRDFKLIWGGKIIDKEILAGNFAIEFEITSDKCAVGYVGGGWMKLDVRRKEDVGKTGIFNDEFLNLLKPFDGIRCMDWLETNNSTCESFETRPQVSDLTYAFGVPYEICRALAEELQIQLWINVPHMWEADDFMRLARLFANFKLPLLTEFSNETWNGQFQQYKYIQAKGQILFPNEPNQFYRGYMYNGYMANQLGGEFVKAGVQNVVPVLSGHIADQSKLFQGLRGISGQRYIKAAAGAPYFGRTEFMARPDLKVDDFFGPYDFTDSKGIHWSGQNYMMDRATKSMRGQDVQDFVTLCTKEGLEPILYEYGKDFGDYRTAQGVTLSRAAKIQASLDPRMAEAVGANMDLWPGRKFYFVLCSRYDRFTWGLTPSVDFVDAPLYQAAVKRQGKANVKIDAALLDLATGTYSPLSGTLDLSGKKTINITTDQPVARLALSVTDLNGKTILSRTETTKPYHLNGDNVAWSVPPGDYILGISAYESGGRLVGSQTINLNVGASELDRYKLMVEKYKGVLTQISGVASNLAVMMAQAKQVCDDLTAAIEKANK